MNNLHACANCCHNALQYDAIGPRVGYCTLHRVVLRQADHTTCGQQFRKDLLYLSAMRAHKRQCEIFPAYEVVKIDGQQLNGEAEAYVSLDRSLFTERVGMTVSEYPWSKRIASLAQLRMLAGGRAELALISLGRVYVRNCMSRDGKWTAGLNIMWWIRERFINEPEPDLRYDQDFRYEMPVAPERQMALAKWSLLMLRLTFLSDMGRHAEISPQKDEASPAIQEASRSVQGLQTIADDAADTAGTDLSLLKNWIRDVGMERLSMTLPKERYEAIQDELHRDPDGA